MCSPFLYERTFFVWRVTVFASLFGSNDPRYSLLVLRTSSKLSTCTKVHAGNCLHLLINYMKLSLSIFLCLFFATNMCSQNCRCEYYSKQQKEIQTYINEANYEKAEELLIKVIDQSSIICKLQGIDDLIKTYIPQKKVEENGSTVKGRISFDFIDRM